MKTGTLERNGVSAEVAALIARLICMIPWPERRYCMGDVALSLLDGKARVAETAFGWGRQAVEVGINEYQSGILCVNDITARRKPTTEDKHAGLLSEIHAIMEPNSESQASLRTTLLYSNVTARSVRDALVQKGWDTKTLPTVRTISNLLNRQNYRLRSVAKAKVQKKPRKQTPSSTTSEA